MHQHQAMSNVLGSQDNSERIVALWLVHRHRVGNLVPKQATAGLFPIVPVETGWRNINVFHFLRQHLYRLIKMITTLQLIFTINIPYSY